MRQVCWAVMVAFELKKKGIELPFRFRFPYAYAKKKKRAKGCGPRKPRYFIFIEEAS